MTDLGFQSHDRPGFDVVTIVVIVVIVVIVLSVVIVVIAVLRSRKKGGNVAMDEGEMGKCGKGALGGTQNPGNFVVLFKTHKWDPGIERRFRKIESEAGPTKVWVLYHGKSVPREIRNVYKCAALEKVYKHGFVDAWLSNHWLLMSWWKSKGRKMKDVDWVWSIEYDVGIVGDSGYLWKDVQDSTDADLLGSFGPFQDESWPYKDNYVGPMVDSDKWFGYLQLSRYSRRFLDYMDEVFERGENGQDEMMIYSLAKRGGFNIETEPLHCLQGFWSALGNDAQSAHDALQEATATATPAATATSTPATRPQLFHPVND